VTCRANSFAETTEPGTPDRTDSTQGCREASVASTFFGGAGLGGAAAAGAAAGGSAGAPDGRGRFLGHAGPWPYDAFRMTFIRSIFFWSAMMP
jgi:hypothetical protein